MKKILNILILTILVLSISLNLFLWSNNEVQCSNIDSRWKPSANTLAYYPLTSESTVNDMKGTGTAYNLTNSGATFGTYQGVDCAYGTASSKYLYYSNFSASSVKTISYWTYWSGSYASSYSNYSIALSMNNQLNIAYGKSGSKFYVWDIEPNFYKTNEWYNLVITSSASNTTCYINGVQIGTGSVLSLNNGLLTLGRFSNNLSTTYDGYLGGISEVIIEDKEWTATEISDYYNATKSKYGL